MPEITIEKAKVSDANQILSIQKEAYLSEAEIYDDYNIPPLTQTLTELVSDFDSHTFYVAKLSGEIVGGVNVKIEKLTGLIGRLIVSPKIQNQGIGTMLMDYVEAKHSDLKAFELFTGYKSEQNLSFYKKLGYQEFKRQPMHGKLAFIFLRKTIANKPLKNIKRIGHPLLINRHPSITALTGAWAKNAAEWDYTRNGRLKSGFGSNCRVQ